MWGREPEQDREQEQEQEQEPRPYVHLRAPGGGDEGDDPLMREVEQGYHSLADGPPGVLPQRSSAESAAGSGGDAPLASAGPGVLGHPCVRPASALPSGTPAASSTGGTAAGAGPAQGEMLPSRGGADAQSRAGRRVGDAVERVFAHWQRLYGHPKAVLDSKRRKIITNALAAYSEADLCRSIEGYQSSPHHMGQNERATVYDDIELFLRDARHIEAGLKFATALARSDLSTLSRKNVAAVANWVPPEMRHAGK